MALKLLGALKLMGALKLLLTMDWPRVPEAADDSEERQGGGQHRAVLRRRRGLHLRRRNRGRGPEAELER